MNKQLERMEDIQKSILKISDEMSELIGSGTIKTMDKLEKGYETATEKQEQLHENLNENKEELLNAIKNSKEDYQKRRLELEERFEHLKKEFMYSKLFGTRRLLIAFPGMKHNLYQKMIDKLKDNK
jgi:Na+/phosphate symporter